MSEVSRRAFLGTGASAAAAGAVLATTGMTSGVLAAKSADSPDPAADAAAVASVGNPIIVHIRDAKTGEMSIFSGESEITHRDPQLVARVARATRRNVV